MRRTERVEIRVSEAELAELKEKAEASGRSVSELVRKSVIRARTWTAADKQAARERNMQLARIGSNLNQVARWANTHKSAADAVQVLAALASIEREMNRLFFPTAQKQERSD